VSPRTQACTDAIAAGRMRKAEQFADAAEAIGDAYVRLLIHAGIAAADVTAPGCAVSAAAQVANASVEPIAPAPTTATLTAGPAATAPGRDRRWPR
jgi:hypothetical protein